MAEKNDFTHLPLPLLFQGKPKLRGGGAVSAQTKRNTANRIAHGSYVKRRSAELSRFWKERRAERSENALPEIETGIPILLEIDPSADIDFLRGLGFEIVCEIEEGFIIVATEDVDLSTLNEKADAFIANVTTRCNSPAKVYALCEDGDRLKRVLSKELYAKWATVSPDEAYIIDIGVSCCGNIELPKRPKREDDETDEHYSVREQRWMEKFSAAYMAWDEIKMKREETIERFVSDYNGEIMQLADGISEMTDLPDSFSARLKISGKCLLDLVLNFAYIFEVSEAETIIMGEAPENNDSLTENVQIEAPIQSAPIVCVMDSGIQEEHKYASCSLSRNLFSSQASANSVSYFLAMGKNKSRTFRSKYFVSEKHLPLKARMVMLSDSAAYSRNAQSRSRKIAVSFLQNAGTFISSSADLQTSSLQAAIQGTAVPSRPARTASVTCFALTRGCTRSAAA